MPARPEHQRQRARIGAHRLDRRRRRGSVQQREFLGGGKGRPFRRPHPGHPAAFLVDQDRHVVAPGDAAQASRSARSSWSWLSQLRRNRMKPAGSASRKKSRSSALELEPFETVNRRLHQCADEAILAGRLERLAHLLGVGRRRRAGAEPDPAREGDDHLVERRDGREARRQRGPGALGLRRVGEGAELDDAARAAARGRLLRFRRDAAFCVSFGGTVFGRSLTGLATGVSGSLLRSSCESLSSPALVSNAVSLSPVMSSPPGLGGLTL